MLYDILGLLSNFSKQRYKYAFNNNYIVEDVYKSPELYDYSPKKRRSVSLGFLSCYSHDLSKISRFENMLHSRYGRLESG